MAKPSLNQHQFDRRWVELNPDQAKRGVTYDSVTSYHDRLIRLTWAEIARVFHGVEAIGPVAVFVIAIDGDARDFWEARLQVEAEAQDSLALDLFGAELPEASDFLRNASPSLAPALNPESIPSGQFAVIVQNKSGTSVCYQSIPVDYS